MTKSDMLNIFCKEVLGEELTKLEEKIKNGHTGGTIMTTKADAILNSLEEEQAGAETTGQAAPGVTGVNPNTDVGKDLDMVIAKAGKQMDQFIGKGDDKGAEMMKKAIASMKQASQHLGGEEKPDGLPSDKK